jgi:FtsH-binding integral membrane protein
MAFYEMEYPVVAQTAASARAAFIRRTYAHLAGAVLAFVALEALLLQLPIGEQIVRVVWSGGSFGWLFILLAFMGASWLAQTWARSETSRGMQYLGLALYVVAEAIIILPLLYIADRAPIFHGKHLIAQAGILTLAMFGGLTLSVFLTKKDFSYLGPIISVGSMIALGVIVCAILFTFTLGLLFSFAMVALLSAFILYETSNVMLHYRTDQHVAASLMLFASIATLFWYILRILMILNSRN